MMPELKELEKILACPFCFQKVILSERKFWCTGAECRRSYPIDDQDIPQMLVSQATVEATAAAVEAAGKSVDAAADQT